MPEKLEEHNDVVKYDHKKMQEKVEEMKDYVSPEDSGKGLPFLVVLAYVLLYVSIGIIVGFLVFIILQYLGIGVQ